MAVLPTTNLKLHCDASTVVNSLWQTYDASGNHKTPPSHGDPVEVWDDQGDGISDVAMIRTAANTAPTFNSTPPAMVRPSLYFDGTTDRLKATDQDGSPDKVDSTFIANNAFTIAIAFRPTAISANAANPPGNHLLIGDSNFPFGLEVKVDTGVYYVEGWNFDGTYDKISRTIALNRSWVAVFRHSSGNLELTVIDDTGTEDTASSVASGNTSSLGSNTIYVGQTFNAGGAFYNGYIGEFAIWNDAKSGSDLTDIKTYFKDKWLTAVAPVSPNKGSYWFDGLPNFREGNGDSANWFDGIPSYVEEGGAVGSLTLPLMQMAATGDSGFEGYGTLTLPLMRMDAEAYQVTESRVSSVAALVLSTPADQQTDVSSVAALVLSADPPQASSVSSVAALVLSRTPPQGGGQIPPLGTFPQGILPRNPKRFVTVRMKDGTVYAMADTVLRDEVDWYTGFKPAQLAYVSPVEMELSRQGYRTKTCTIRLLDDNNRWRQISNSDTIVGTYWAVYLIDDEVRWAKGDPWQIYGGFCVSHTGVDEFEFEVVCEDPLGRFLSQEDQPLCPPHQLTLEEFAGLDESFDGKSAPVAVGKLVSGFGVVPNVFMGQINLQEVFGTIDQLVDVHLFSELAMTKIVNYYYNIPTWAPEIEVFEGDMYRPTEPNEHIYKAIVGGTTSDTEPDPWPTGEGLTVVDGGVTWEEHDDDSDRRFVVPNEAYGTVLISPHKPGWFTYTGLSVNWVDYGTPPRRYGGLVFIDPAHRYAKALREGRMQLYMEAYGINENPDASGRYFDSVEEALAFLIANYLYTETDGITYAGMPMIDGEHGIIDRSTIDEARAVALEEVVPDGYVCAFLLGRDGNQQKVWDIVDEGLKGARLELGTNRFGQIVFSRQKLNQSAVLQFTEFFHHIKFNAGQSRDDFKNYIPFFFAYNYGPAVSTNPTPRPGDPLPKTNYPQAEKFESGYREYKDDDSINWTGQRNRFVLENYVIRDEDVAEAVALAYLNQFLGPADARDGPRDFRMEVPLVEGLGRIVDGEIVEVKLGTVIGVTDREGLEQTGYHQKRVRVRKIVYDTEEGVTRLSGRVLDNPDVEDPEVPDEATECEGITDPIVDDDFEDGLSLATKGYISVANLSNQSGEGLSGTWGLRGSGSASQKYYAEGVLPVTHSGRAFSIAADFDHADSAYSAFGYSAFEMRTDNGAGGSQATYMTLYHGLGSGADRSILQLALMAEDGFDAIWESDEGVIIPGSTQRITVCGNLSSTVVGSDISADGDISVYVDDDLLVHLTGKKIAAPGPFGGASLRYVMVGAMGRFDNFAVKQA